MDKPRTITLERGWAILLKDLGIDPSDVLRRARLPLTLWADVPAQVTIPEYFRLVEAVGEEGTTPDFAIQVATSFNG